MRMKDKVVLVTGGSLGIGRAIAVRLAQEGAKIAISGRGQASLEEAAALIEQGGGEVLTLASDVQDKTQVDRMIDEVLAKWGTIDVLVHNAGVNSPTPFLDISQEEWNRHIQINLTGSFLVSQRVCQEMVRRKQPGVVIVMSSVNGLSGEAHFAHYKSSACYG